MPSLGSRWFKCIQSHAKQSFAGTARTRAVWLLYGVGNLPAGWRYTPPTAPAMKQGQICATPAPWTALATMLPGRTVMRSMRSWKTFQMLSFFTALMQLWDCYMIIDIGRHKTEVRCWRGRIKTSGMGGEQLAASTKEVWSVGRMKKKGRRNIRMESVERGWTYKKETEIQWARQISVKKPTACQMTGLASISDSHKIHTQ